MRLDYEDIQVLLKLENRDGINEQIPCFDYISSIYNEDEQWVVEIFVEPVGDIKVKGETLKQVLEFWLELFRSQPKDWDYAKAGWHLDRVLQLSTFKWETPADAHKVWTIEKKVKQQ